jgi:hypothetical protein
VLKLSDLSISSMLCATEVSSSISNTRMGKILQRLRLPIRSPATNR